MRLLGIDYGLTRIGLAYSEGQLAQPLPIVTAQTHADRLKKVLAVIAQYDIDTIVIGRTPSTINTSQQKFINGLKQTFSGPIYLVEEAMTTVDAQNRAIQTGMKRSKRQNKIDSLAAAVILESYLGNMQQ